MTGATDATGGVSQIAIDQPIKTLGLYPVRVALHPELVETVTVNVARNEEAIQPSAACVCNGIGYYGYPFAKEPFFLFFCERVIGALHDKFCLNPVRIN